MRDARLIGAASDAVAATLRELPPDVREAARAVPVLFEPAPGRDVLDEGFEPDLLGLFSGSPLGTEFSGEVPEAPRIFLYTANLWEHAGGDMAAFRAEARLTYLHELGHYLGWDEDQVSARGLE